MPAVVQQSHPFSIFYVTCEYLQANERTETTNYSAVPILLHKIRFHCICTPRYLCACAFMLPGVEPCGSDPTSEATSPAEQRSDIQQVLPEQDSPAPQVITIGGMSEGTPRCHEEFEDFAAKMQSPDTLKAAQNLLKRFATRLGECSEKGIIM